MTAQGITDADEAGDARVMNGMAWAGGCVSMFAVVMQELMPYILDDHAASLSTTEADPPS